MTQSEISNNHSLLGHYQKLIDYTNRLRTIDQKKDFYLKKMYLENKRLRHQIETLTVMNKSLLSASRQSVPEDTLDKEFLGNLREFIDSNLMLCPENNMLTFRQLVEGLHTFLKRKRIDYKYSTRVLYPKIKLFLITELNMKFGELVSCEHANGSTIWYGLRFHNGNNENDCKNV